MKSRGRNFAIPICLFAALFNLPITQAIPDIDNPTLEGALDETGYDEIIQLTNERNGSLCWLGGVMSNRSILMKPAAGLERAVLACPEKEVNGEEVKYPLFFDKHLTIINIDIIYRHFLIHDHLVITFVNCNVVNTDIWSRGVESVHLQVVNSTFRGHVNSSCVGEPDCRTTTFIDAFSNNVSLWFKDTAFYQTFSVVRAGYADKIEIDNCTISNDDSVERVHRGIYIQVNQTTSDKPITYNIRDSVFEKQIFRDPVISAINLFYGTLTLNVQHASNISLNVTGCTFRDNERAFQITGSPKSVTIRNCTFNGNEAMHSGPAILSQASPDTQILIQDSLFMNNVAGSYRLHKNLPDDDSVMVNDDLITLNTTCCLGTLRLSGKGGAIALEGGKMRIENSKFINNSATAFGGTIFSNRGTVLDLDGAYMEPGTHHKSGNADILYSLGNTSVSKAVFNITTLKKSQAVIEHAGGVWSMKIFDLYIQCPVGFDVRTENESKYAMHQFQGIQRSFAVDKIFYKCRKCRYYYYYEGQDFGYLNYSVGRESLDMLHYTMVWKLNKPNEVHTAEEYMCLLNGGEAACTAGYIDHHDVTCGTLSSGSHYFRAHGSFYWPCPPGPNKSNRRVWSAVDCPVGYCREALETGQRNCANNRSGALCGSCDSGFTELLFTAQCIPDERCNPAAFWITYLLMGLAYVLLGVALAWMTLWVNQGSSRSLSDQRITFSGQNVEVETVSDTAQLTVKESLTSDGGENGCPILDVIVIIVYFYQDSFLFHKVNYGYKSALKPNHDYYDIINVIISLFVRFKWSIFARLGNFCVISGASSIVNRSMLILQVPSIILIFIITIAIWHFVLHKKVRLYRSMEGSKTELITQLLWHGLFLTLILTFQGHVLETTTIVKCLSCREQSMLYINGNISCTPPWQYVVYLYIALWLAPFFLILTFGKYLFVDQEISVSKFVLHCLCPLPASVYVIVKLLISKIQGPSSAKIRTEDIDDSNMLAKFFQNSQTKVPLWLNYLCCHGIIVMFRFTMVILYTFNDDVMNGLIGILVVVFLKQLYTVLALPYSSVKTNWLSVAGDTTVFVVGGINMAAGNIARATYMHPTFIKTFKILRHVEAVFLIWLPLLVTVVGIINIVIVTKRRKP